MNPIFRLLALSIFSFLLTACAESSAPEDTGSTTNSNAHAATEQTEATQAGINQAQAVRAPEPLPLLPKDSFSSVDWTDLIPEMDLMALKNPPEALMNIEDGSEEDVIGGKLSNTPDSDVYSDGNDLADSAFQRALVSTNTVSEMQGKHIKLPGFIVPLDFDDDQTITEFFLVPYFGACLHLPPPPPNQIIYVSHPDGIQVDALYDPFWLYGTLDAGITENTTAKSAYRMRLHHIEPYYE
jgi:hypothetical protein